MEHLPTVKYPVSPPTEVPYLCDSTPYDGLGFAGYPERRGWSTATFLRGKFRHSNANWLSDTDVGALLQAWLFFGLLDEFLVNVPLKIEDFINRSRTAGGHPVITTAQLPTYIQAWQKSYKRLSGKERESYLGQIQGCFQVATELSTSTYFEFIESVRVSSQVDDDGKTIVDTTPPLPFEVILSIQILGVTLNNAILGLDGDFPQFTWGAFIPGSDPLTARMLKQGWCKSEVDRLAGKCHVTGLYYASFIPRKSSTRDMHSNCTEEACIANNINDDDYQTKHVTEGCTCAHLGPSSTKVADILRKGGIPLISLSATEAGDISMEVIALRTSVPFVAISHVWSDGMGNVKANTLPTCQLRRLKASVDQLYYENKNIVAGVFSLASGRKPIPIWIDTLCVPLNPQLRRLAISRMRDSYVKAHRVLVVDAELMTHRTRGTAMEESMMKLGVSGWMRRMWTLQEGRLASKLYVIFADGILDVRRAMYELARRGSSKEEAFLSIPLEAGSFLWSLSSDFDDTDDPADNIRQHLLAFKGRTTSKPADAALCLASLLGSDTGMLFDIPGPQRMKAVLTAQKTLPGGILFHSNPRMPGNGNRWVPLSIAHIFTQDTTPAIPQRLGLRVNYPGFLIAPPGVPHFPENYPKGGHWRYFIFEDIRDQRQRRYQVRYGIDHHVEPESSRPRPTESTRFAIILPDVKFQSRITWGIQVIIYKQDDGGYYCYFDSSISIEVEATSHSECSSVWRELVDRQYDPTVFPEGKGLNGTASGTRPDQTWVVG